MQCLFVFELNTTALHLYFADSFVPSFGIIDASPQASPCLFVGLQVPRLKRRVPRPHLAIWLRTTLTVFVSETVLAQKSMYERIADVYPSRSVLLSVASSCPEIHIFVEFQQDGLQVGMIKAPCCYHNAVWVG